MIIDAIFSTLSTILFFILCILNETPLNADNTPNNGTKKLKEQATKDILVV